MGPDETVSMLMAISPKVWEAVAAGVLSMESNSRNRNIKMIFKRFLFGLKKYVGRIYF